MRLSIAPDLQATPFTCDHCDSEHLRIRGLPNSEHGAFATYHAHLHNHGGVHEAYLGLVMDAGLTRIRAPAQRAAKPPADTGRAPDAASSRHGRPPVRRAGPTTTGPAPGSHQAPRLSHKAR
ncbi:hypothetical protein [Nocardiopsis deserti]|uniref:hypothetical protein n=1 Tax=Nocardiopsis deserti TaxID=2605988 RepID=UPI001680A988|nr:hypothetical protein [Nocardiopsis deserti]